MIPTDSVEEIVGQIEQDRIARGARAIWSGIPDIIAALKEGDPSIWTRGQRNLIRIAVAHLIEDEIDIVVGRLRDCLSSAG